MSRSLRVNQESIDVVKSAIKLRGFPTQKSIAEDLGISLSTISNFFNGKPIDFGNFIEICERLGLDWREITQFNEEEYFWQKYELLLKAKEEQIAFYRQENTRLLELIKTLSTTINHGSFASTTHIENLHLENSSNRDRDIISELHSHEVTSDRNQIINISSDEIKEKAKIAGIVNKDWQQNLADTALEIQHLLEQSEHYYPVNSTVA